MADHPWLRSLNTIAICPKCGAPTLRRSHAKSTWEKFFKKHTLKRMFRCHTCGWRGWVDEARLQYPIAGQTIDEPLEQIVNDEIPRLSLEPAPSSFLSEIDERNQTPLKTDAASEQAENIPQVQPADTPQEALPGLDTEPFSKHVPDDFHLMSRHTGKQCPRCLKQTLFRSRHRNMRELLRKKFSRKRPYRCHACGWRGWMVKHF